MASADGAGIMSGAFFVSKGELLKWLNDFFKIGYTKVEDVATGAIHVQILDSIFPGKVPLYKVNFGAKFNYEYVANYKVLQDVFAKEGIKKHVDVETLVKAKYMDNLEFLQWMKHLWDTRYNGEEYDAVGRRNDAIAKYNAGRKSGGKVGIPAGVPKPATSTPAKDAAAAKPAAPSGVPAAAKPKAVATSGAARPAKPAAAPAARAPSAGKESSAASGGDAAKVEELSTRLTKLRLTVDGLEKERNFYFNKLREIEVLCQSEEDLGPALKEKVLEILYAVDGNDEFEAPQDAGAQEQEEAAQDAGAESSNQAPDEEADLTF